MSQISKSRRPEVNSSSSGGTLTKAIQVGFHGTAALTYGFAICWQNVSCKYPKYSQGFPIPCLESHLQKLT